MEFPLLAAIAIRFNLRTVRCPSAPHCMLCTIALIHPLVLRQVGVGGVATPVLIQGAVRRCHIDTATQPRYGVDSEVG